MSDQTTVTYSTIDANEAVASVAYLFSEAVSYTHLRRDCMHAGDALPVQRKMIVLGKCGGCYANGSAQADGSLSLIHI